MNTKDMVYLIGCLLKSDLDNKVVYNNKTNVITIKTQTKPITIKINKC